MPDSTAPGRSLRVLREMAGMTLDQVADEAGVSPTHLSRVETGKAIPTPKWVGTVAEVLAANLRSREVA